MSIITSIYDCKQALGTIDIMMLNIERINKAIFMFALI